ncbi:MAG: putative hydrophobic protein (TIGR00271 family) [Candidatus Paceibacteria bacterium]|jgi:uncharacterized hydrophobic protein (TIGR00271 family)
MELPKDDKPFLTVNNKDRYRAIDDLIEESRPTHAYFTLLILSSVIIASGLLLANSPILIGGMLVTPVLNPILLIALGITVSRPRLIKRTAILILKSVAVIFGISFVAGILFSAPEVSDLYRESLFDNSLRAAFLYFLVAFTSGIAATFSWIRKEITNVLPGISIAVSLVPPISMVAIWLSMGQIDLMRFFLMVFLFNMFGIIMGGLVIFSLLRFYSAGQHIKDKVDEVILQEAGYKTNNK